MKKTILSHFLLIALWFIAPLFSLDKISYEFQKEPIDVVIPCTEKDLDTLNFCINGIKRNCPQVRRVIVVSKNHLTDKAEWFPESSYPFSKEDVAFELFKNKEEAARYMKNPRNRVGWMYQQLLKFYAPFVIKGISSNVLLLDADTVFLNPVTFMRADGAGYLNVGSEYHVPYFMHMKRLLPDLYKLYPQYSGITHHMLFQKCVLNDLKNLIESYQKEPLWKALIHCSDHAELFGSAFSEYEIYFNFVLLRNNQVTIRPLKWTNVHSVTAFASYKAQGYHYVSAHAWSR